MNSSRSNSSSMIVAVVVVVDVSNDIRNIYVEENPAFHSEDWCVLWRKDRKTAHLLERDRKTKLASNRVSTSQTS